MPRHHMTQHGPVPFTQAEEDARDAFEAVKNAKKPMEDWKESMQETDHDMPRYMEDLITNNATFVIPTEMKKRYDAKIKVRGERP
jgi:mRNA-degrading endonuclease HigB of HigAB toxin-antitoxin module